jgi:hypothetical protein
MRKKEVEPITLKHIIPVQSMLALLYNRQATGHHINAGLIMMLP